MSALKAPGTRGHHKTLRNTRLNHDLTVGTLVLTSDTKLGTKVSPFKFKF